MTHDVTQWLNEIKTLKQQLAAAQQERDEAYTSATNWRRLYETEAQQRRTEAHLARETIETLQIEIQQLQGMPQTQLQDPASVSAIQQEVAQLQIPAELQAKLAEALIERDRLLQALKLEQAEHAQTRKSLTTALGDTIELLTKERSAHQALNKGTGAITPATAPTSDLAKTPSPELPSPGQAQFPA